MLARRIAIRDHARRDVSGYDGARSDESALANANVRQDGYIGPYLCSCANVWARHEVG